MKVCNGVVFCRRDETKAFGKYCILLGNQCTGCGFSCYDFSLFLKVKKDLTFKSGAVMILHEERDVLSVPSI